MSETLSFCRCRSQTFNPWDRLAVSIIAEKAYGTDLDTDLKSQLQLSYHKIVQESDRGGSGFRSMACILRGDRPKRPKRGTREQHTSAQTEAVNDSPEEESAERHEWSLFLNSVPWHGDWASMR